jgi:hypothetical protein
VRVSCIERSSWLDPGRDHDDGVALIIIVTRYSMESECACCGNLSTSQPITLNKVSLESLWQCRQSPMKYFTLFAYLRGVIYIWKIWPLTHCLDCFAFLPLHSPWFAIRKVLLLGNYLSPLLRGFISHHFWDFGVQTWPNLHKISQKSANYIKFGPQTELISIVP